jgi:virginiamycin B lyase
VKTRKKGIIFFAVVAGIMLASGITIAIPGKSSVDNGLEVFVAGDGYTDDERPQFCGTNDKAKSTDFVTEFKIPTACTQPLAITTEPNGTVWFAQTNTGNIAKFDPVTEKFTEYTNSRWVDAESQLKQKLRSMMWGMDYSPDGAIWYTDEASDSIWRFSIADETYNTINFPIVEDISSLPQKLLVDGSDVIVNDFTGGKLTIFGYSQLGELSYASIPSPLDGFTSDFTVDSEDNIWYTNWSSYTDYENPAGILIKFDHKEWESQLTISSQADSLLLQNFVQFFQFPSGMTTPNGVAIGPNQNIWIVDTTSSYFFSFDPVTEEFTKYVTSVPTIDSYGNASGFIKSPISRPYWIEHAGDNLVMNEQTANRIGVFNPSTETLVEYTVPSRNPNWSDCEGIEYCGVAQVFDFAIDGKKIWFTEWVENNIGVVDTSISLPFSIDIDTRSITLEKGQTANVMLYVISTTSDLSGGITVNSSTTSLFSDIVVTSEPKELYLDDGSKTIPIQITASENALSGIHKVLLGVYNNEIAVSQFITVTIV